MAAAAAAASVQNAEDSVLCPICLDVLTNPVSTPCGHNFCLDCITDYWMTITTVLKCPLCKEKFFSRPNLQVNTSIAEIATELYNPPRSRSTPEKAGNEKVLCDRCSGAKLEAIKSCLVCFSSFCEEHLIPHQRIEAMKKHKLIQPTRDLESRLCKTHDNILELFCRVDQMFVCQTCKDTNHKTHEVVNVEDEAQMRKTGLGVEKGIADEMIEARKKIAEIQKAVEASRTEASKALSCSAHAMTAMMDYIRRSQAQLAEVIETKQKKIETERNCLIKELEAEVLQVLQRKSELNDAEFTNDTLRSLEKFLSLTFTQPQVKNWSDVTFDGDEFTEQGAVAALEKTVTKEIKMLCDPDWKELRRHAVDVTLDPDTAHPLLVVSPDGKQVTRGDGKTTQPKKPERFDHVLNVLAKEGFSSGKFYYEIQVEDKNNWDLGVANQSINRKGDIRLSPRNGYWTIHLRKGKELTANAGPPVNITVRQTPKKVGVFVHYEVGEVSFYDADSGARLFSFAGWSFTEKIFPFFSPWANDGDNNPAPLIITLVTPGS
ncbi:LOW QUALITY PROTEIN: E3 ubiquitin-protein ligase TRIM21-like [Spinachia spinachia]